MILGDRIVGGAVASPCDPDECPLAGQASQKLAVNASFAQLMRGEDSPLADEPQQPRPSQNRHVAKCSHFMRSVNIKPHIVPPHGYAVSATAWTDQVRSRRTAARQAAIGPRMRYPAPA